MPDFTVRSLTFLGHDAYPLEIALEDNERIVSVETLSPNGASRVWIADDRDRAYQTARLAADNALSDYDFSGVCGY